MQLERDIMYINDDSGFERSIIYKSAAWRVVGLPKEHRKHETRKNKVTVKIYFNQHRVVRVNKKFLENRKIKLVRGQLHKKNKK